MECIFCKITGRELPADIIYENDDWLAFLDIKPVNLGHTLLIPKVHSQNLFDLDDQLLAKAGPVIKKLGQAIVSALGADGFNLGMNNNRAAGQLILHAHFHLIPRFVNDGHRHWVGKTNIADSDFSSAADKIRQTLVKN